MNWRDVWDAVSKFLRDLSSEVWSSILAIARHPVKRIIALVFPLAVILGDVSFDTLHANWLLLALMLLIAELFNRLTEPPRPRGGRRRTRAATR